MLVFEFHVVLQIIRIEKLHNKNVADAKLFTMQCCGIIKSLKSHEWIKLGTPEEF